MSLLIGLESAIRSIRANTTALNTTEHNIANMNTVGYSRQLANMAATTPVDNTEGAGKIGTGTYVSRMERIRDLYLDRQIRAELTKLGEYDALSRTYSNLRVVFTEIDNPTGPGLSSELKAFWDSWDTLSAKVDSDPLNTSAERADVYAKADNLTRLLRERAQGLIDMQVDLNSEMRYTVDAINGYANEIAELNKGIVMQTPHQAPNDLLDKRDVALANLSKLVNISINNRTDGAVVVSIQGQTLVAGSQVQALTWSAASKDSKLEDLSLVIGKNKMNITKFIQSGTLGGLLKARDQIIGQYRTQLDILANSLITTFNKIHTVVSVSGTTPSGVAFFDGSRAIDMSVNSELVNGEKIVVTKDYTKSYGPPPTTATMNVAKIFANLENKLMATWVRSEFNKTDAAGNIGVTYNTDIGSAAGGIGMAVAPGEEFYINGSRIVYNANETIGSLIDRINNISPDRFIAFIGSMSADAKQQQLFIMANDTITVDETDTKDLISKNKLVLRSETISGAPLNYPNAIEGNYVSTAVVVSPPFVVPPLPVGSDSTWSIEKNRLDVALQGSVGEINVIYNGNTTVVPWTTNAAWSWPPPNPPFNLPNPDRLTNTFTNIHKGISAVDTYYSYTEDNPTQAPWDRQKVSFSADARVVGTNYYIKPFYMSDRQGNMTQTLKLVSNTRFEDYYAGIISNMKSNSDSATSIQDEYKFTVDNLQAMQDAVTKVDENEELAMAKKYQRAYDASVRVMAVIDQMLNMLINHMGTSSSSDSSN